MTQGDLLSHVGRSRVLLVFAPHEGDGRLALQRQSLRAGQASMQERDVAVLEMLGSSADDLRMRHRYRSGAGFLAVLIGKDGGPKLVSDEPLMVERLAAVIDAMPMRRSEAAARREVPPGPAE